jgi:3-oxoacyl-ACP reductase-like protein
MDGTYSTHGEVRNTSFVLVGISEEISPLGRYRRRWKDNINMDIYETGCKDMDWFHLAQDRG